jgi:hypothetical protein
VGFNPYKTIRRARMTRRGDLIYVGFFVLLCLAAVVWALS